MESIIPIPIISARRKQPDERTTLAETSSFRPLAGELIWAGSGTLPQAAYVGTTMKQCIPRLQVKDLCDANGIDKEMKELKPCITFPENEGKTRSVSILPFYAARSIL